MPSDYVGYAADGPTTDIGRSKTPTLKTYIGCKIIAAEPMTHEAFLKSQGKWQENQEAYGDGYRVIYADNYISWSPKDVFEESYREVSMKEYILLNK